MTQRHKMLNACSCVHIYMNISCSGWGLCVPHLCHFRWLKGKRTSPVNMRAMFRKRLISTLRPHRFLTDLERTAGEMDGELTQGTLCSLCIWMWCWQLWWLMGRDGGEELGKLCDRNSLFFPRTVCVNIEVIQKMEGICKLSDLPCVAQK